MAKTLFLSVSDIRLLIARVGFDRLYHLLAARLIQDFKRWPEFEKSSRLASYSPTGVIELMPISDATRFSFKYVNGHPRNFAHQMSTVMAFGCLSEVETGFPLLLSEMTILTAIRTAATSATAAQALARPSPRRIALIGNGAQSEFQVLAFNRLLGVEQFQLFDIDPTATNRLVRNLEPYKELHLTISSSAQDAIADADIVTTATASKKHQHVLTPSMIAPGVHLNAIGGDCPGKTELSPEVLEMGKVVVEFAPQARTEGEIQQMSPDFKVTELWEVLTDRSTGRSSEAEITIFDSVGFSLEDYSTLSLMYDLATQESVGTHIDLIPEMSDVKDLFGCLS